MKNTAWKSALCAAFLSFFAGTGVAKTTVYSMDAMIEKRSAIINIPEKLLEEKIQAPVIIALHGPGSSSSVMEYQTDLLEKAEALGMSVVFVNGSKRDNYRGYYWNTSPFLQEEEYSIETDEDFIKGIIRLMDEQGVVDHGRIFVAGHSMGGMMAYKLACQMSDTFAAVAVVSGAMTTEDCAPNQPVSVLHIHGIDDDRVPFWGGEAFDGSGVFWPDATSEIQKWENRQSCMSPAAFMVGEKAYCTITSCDKGARVSMCSVYDAGHDWMGKAQSRAQQRLHGENTDEFSATNQILEFFSQEHGRVAPIVP